MISRVRRAGGLAALWLALAAAFPAAAQYNQTSTTTFVIYSATAPVGEQIAQPGQPLLVQDVTATRAARLEEESVSLLGMGQMKSFPAGTPMFGVQVPDGWIYCAVSISSSQFWFGDVFACYQDTDADGQFDVVRNSGAPFAGIPIFVFQPGPAVRLPKPVRYTEIPHALGPKVQLGLVWRPVGPKRRKDDPPLIPTSITVDGEIIHDKVSTAISDPVTIATPAGSTPVIRRAGAVITVLGFTPEGAIRYRVERTMPAQVAPMQMTVTTSTYYYVVYY